MSSAPPMICPQCKTPLRFLQTMFMRVGEGVDRPDVADVGRCSTCERQFFRDRGRLMPEPPDFKDPVTPSEFERRRVARDHQRARSYAFQAVAKIALLPDEAQDLVRLLMDAVIVADVDESARLEAAMNPTPADLEPLKGLAEEIVARHGGPDVARAKFERLYREHFADA